VDSSNPATSAVVARPGAGVSALGWSGGGGLFAAAPVLFSPLLVLGFVAPLILSVSDMSFPVVCCEFDFFLQFLFPAVHNN
jgi:hypothetical protein